MVTQERQKLRKNIRTYPSTHTAVPFPLVMDDREIKSVSKQGYSRPTMLNFVLNQLESDVFI